MLFALSEKAHPAQRKRRGDAGSAHWYRDRRSPIQLARRFHGGMLATGSGRATSLGVPKCAQEKRPKRAWRRRHGCMFDGLPHPKNRPPGGSRELLACHQAFAFHPSALSAGVLVMVIEEIPQKSTG